MKIAVLICVYNPNEFFIEQLDSILCQIPLDVDLIISNDSNSFNSTLKKIQINYCNRVSIVTGPRMKHAKYNFIWSLKSLNKEYDWLFFSDQDDVWCCEKFEEYLKIIASKAKSSLPTLIFSDAIIIESDGKIIADSFMKHQRISGEMLVHDDLLFRNCAQGATFCLNSHLINLVNYLTPTIDSIDNIVMHDWWIAIIARYYGEIRFIDIPLIKYRQHDNNVVGARSQVESMFLELKSISNLLNKIKNIQKQMIYFMNVSQELGGRRYIDFHNLKLGRVSYIKFLIMKFLKFME